MTLVTKWVCIAYCTSYTGCHQKLIIFITAFIIQSYQKQRYILKKTTTIFCIHTNIHTVNRYQAWTLWVNTFIFCRTVSSKCQIYCDDANLAWINNTIRFTIAFQACNFFIYYKLNQGDSYVSWTQKLHIGTMIIFHLWHRNTFLSLIGIQFNF